MSDAIADRIAAIIEKHGLLDDSGGICECGYCSRSTSYERHLAQTIVEELPAWDLLMSILGHTYPATVFPTLPDDPNRDPGPRIVSLIRRINDICESTTAGMELD